MAGDDFGPGVGDERHDPVSGLAQDGTGLLTAQDSLGGKKKREKSVSRKIKKNYQKTKKSSPYLFRTLVFSLFGLLFVAVVVQQRFPLLDLRLALSSLLRQTQEPRLCHRAARHLPALLPTDLPPSLLTSCM